MLEVHILDHVLIVLMNPRMNTHTHTHKYKIDGSSRSEKDHRKVLREDQQPIHLYIIFKFLCKWEQTMKRVGGFDMALQSSDMTSIALHIEV